MADSRLFGNHSGHFSTFTAVAGRAVGAAVLTVDGVGSLHFPALLAVRISALSAPQPLPDEVYKLMHTTECFASVLPLLPEHDLTRVR